MPYIHKHCGGEIRWKPFLPINPKCKKCGKTWSWLIQFGGQPKDMYYFVPVKDRKPAKYAKWGDKVPYVSTVASALPNWPRWARILTGIGILGISAGIIWLFLTLLGRI